MRTVFAQPGYTEEQVRTLIESKQSTYADCYTLELIKPMQGIAKLRYTNYQYRVSVMPIDEIVVRSYLAGRVLIDGLRFKIGVGVEVDEQTLRLIYREDDVVPYSGDEWEGTPFAVALKRGDFDGARITRDRYYTSAPGSLWLGGIRLFSGRVSMLDSVSRTECRMKVKSDLVLLDQPMPHNLWQPSCTHTLYDAGCGLDRSDFSVQGETDGVSTHSAIKWSGTAETYKLGTIYLENNNEVVFVRTIRGVNMDDGELLLSYPLDFIPPSGTQFVVYPGCARTMERCQELAAEVPGRDWKKFFKGFPFVPPPETAY